MKQSTKDKIQEAVDDLKSNGGLKDPNVKKVIDKLKKALKDEDKSKK